jgi:hypothetical protein
LPRGQLKACERFLTLYLTAEEFLLRTSTASAVEVLVTELLKNPSKKSQPGLLLVAPGQVIQDKLVTKVSDLKGVDWVEENVR